MRNFFHTCLVITSLLVCTVSFFIVSTAYGQENKRRICRACIDCLPNYDKTLFEKVIVPKNAVMLNENPAHCSPDSVAEHNPKPISLFIIIDHSASMGVYDPKSKRYEAARALIDTLYNHLPNSEIGIAIFSNKLLFHSEDDPIFKKKKSSQGWKDSYIPLQQLNKKIGNMKVTDKLKWSLELDPNKVDNAKSKNYYLVNGNYTSSGRRPYSGTTDVSLAFEAAIEALKTAKYPKDRQFIVFFSDGFSQYVDTDREKTKFDYIKGKNVPCTFTTYFVTRGQPVPKEIKNMTENIKTNGYSSSNELSQVWRTQGEISSYFDEMIAMLKGQMVYTSKPKSLTVNNVTSTKFDETKVFFNAPFAPLNKDGELKLNISYTFRWDPPKDFEATKEYTVNLKQGSKSEIDTCKCWWQGRIAYFSDEGEELKESAALNQKDIEIRFYPPEGENSPPFEGNSVKIELTNKARSDKVELILYKQGKYFLTHFVREYGDAKKDDDVLQNSKDNDSIIAIYQNPDIPLDIVYHGILSSPEERIELKKSYYLDVDANGFPDKIRAAQVSEKPLTQDDCELIKDYADMDTPRRIDGITELELKENILYFSFEEPEKLVVSDLFTGIYANSSGKSREKLAIGKMELPSGVTFPSTDIMIYDGMAPVIIEGTFCPAFITDEKAKIPDTLVVQFSEPVKPVKNSVPFKFIRDSEEYTMRLKLIEGSGVSNIQRFLVKELSRQPKAGDLLWIDHTANVQDENNNDQKNEKNRRAPLKIKPHHFTIEVTAWPNPATPDDFLKHKVQIDGLTDKKGVIVKARVLGKWFADIDLSGSLQLFDGVGNLVINLTGTSADDEGNDGIKESVIFVWNGGNSNLRKVFSGGYFGIVSVTSEEGYTQKAEVMLGVKSDKTAQ